MDGRLPRMPQGVAEFSDKHRPVLMCEFYHNGARLESRTGDFPRFRVNTPLCPCLEIRPCLARNRPKRPRCPPCPTSDARACNPVENRPNPLSSLFFRHRSRLSSSPVPPAVLGCVTSLVGARSVDARHPEQSEALNLATRRDPRTGRQKWTVAETVTHPGRIAGPRAGRVRATGPIPGLRRPEAPLCPGSSYLPFACRSATRFNTPRGLSPAHPGPDHGGEPKCHDPLQRITRHITQRLLGYPC